MISRRKILSRSRDDIANYREPCEEEEDVWYQKEKLFKDHIQEVLNKWDHIDDEIWAKIIVMERNQRVAKAYARASVLTLNGSDVGFDGYRIGLNGFENNTRDAKTAEAKKHIGQGIKMKMDEEGNILIKSLDKSVVFVKGWKQQILDTHSASIGEDILESRGKLEMDKPCKLFDMKKFQANVTRELRGAYPDRRRLESQCISVIAFGRDASELLELPCWLMVINVVSLEMLKSKLPSTSPVSSKVPKFVPTFKEKPRYRSISDDPYSYNNSSSLESKSSDSLYFVSNQKASKDPPKLPPRDKQPPADDRKRQTTRCSIPSPDYESGPTRESMSQVMKGNCSKEDLYYCGLSARTPNFGKLKENNIDPKKGFSREKELKVENSYGSTPRPAPNGFFSSAMRRLPVHSKAPSIDSSRTFPSFESDPSLDPNYGHIYSSIPDYAKYSRQRSEDTMGRDQAGFVDKKTRYFIGHWE